MNSYLNDRKAIDRLKKEYQEHGKLIIGFDFDCTIYDYHDEKLELQPLVSLLRECSDLGFTMCLYSICQNESNVLFKTKYCNNHNIKVDYFNMSPVLMDQPGSYPKPFFSILLDDRAGLSASYNILKTTLVELDLI